MPACMKSAEPAGKLRACPRSCTQHRTRSGRLAERKTFDGKRCHNCGFAPDAGDTEVRFVKASDL